MRKEFTNETISKKERYESGGECQEERGKEKEREECVGVKGETWEAAEYSTVTGKNRVPVCQFTFSLSLSLLTNLYRPIYLYVYYTSYRLLLSIPLST